jgi:FlaA1/EpsC-like NDP-sugar epimerase
MKFFNIDSFIKTHITLREKSFFEEDVLSFKDTLSTEIKDKAIIVIGGAGTIGASFIKSVLAFQPAKLCVVDTNENGLTELTRDLRSTMGQFVPKDYITYPMNFGDPVFEKMFISEGPFDIVANFAAHKHVRSEKDKFSVEAMIDNNVIKAKKLLDLLLSYKPKHFFCVSTDKAANPVNVMGASKKLMEEVIMAYSSEIKITTARFANVAFSNGSLLDGYIHRMMKRQPLSCPSDVKRFFVSPEESGQICMLACILGRSGDVFFPKLYEDTMVNFKDITEAFINEMGFESCPCQSEEEAKNMALSSMDFNKYPVFYFNSDTSGEKLFEEFFTDQDTVDMETYGSLGIVKNAKRPSKSEIQKTIEDLQIKFCQPYYDKADIVNILKKYLPDFQHIETGKSLDNKM